MAASIRSLSSKMKTSQIWSPGFWSPAYRELYSKKTSQSFIGYRSSNIRAYNSKSVAVKKNRRYFYWIGIFGLGTSISLGTSIYIYDHFVSSNQTPLSV